MNCPSQQQLAPPSFGERVALAAVLALIALVSHLATLRGGGPSFAPDPLFPN